MRTMKLFSICLLASVASSCTVGDFCAVYEPVEMSEEAAGQLLEADRNAAKKAAANNAYFYEYCK